jgi:hypothetical protein
MRVSQQFIPETPSYKWEDEKLITYYKKRAREICAQLELEERNKKKGLLNFSPIQFKPKFNFKFRNSRNTSTNSKHIKIPKIISNFPTQRTESETVLTMLFPYVKEEHFHIEPFKTGADIIRERKFKPNLNLIKLNQEKRIKSNFNKKFKKYDKELNTYADTPSIRCSSAYTTEDQVYRRELIQSKLKWVVPEDFRRVFGRRTANDRIKEDTINNHVENDIYIEPFKIDRFRKMDKSKWVSKKNFIV